MHFQSSPYTTRSNIPFNILCLLLFASTFENKCISAEWFRKRFHKGSTKEHKYAITNTRYTSSHLKFKIEITKLLAENLYSTFLKAVCKVASMHLSGGHLPKHPEDYEMIHSCLSMVVEIPFFHFAEANLKRTACHKKTLRAHNCVNDLWKSPFPYPKTLLEQSWKSYQTPY